MIHNLKHWQHNEKKYLQKRDINTLLKPQNYLQNLASNKYPQI